MRILGIFFFLWALSLLLIGGLETLVLLGYLIGSPGIIGEFGLFCKWGMGILSLWFSFGWSCRNPNPTDSIIGFRACKLVCKNTMGKMVAF